ncbi:hypothetical protein BDY19DRAFT_959691 [Irpex rosettiformis]|uniref:Uncharacterized protein n=1 Tax=Irpex rosettiformis TaxID=378272 RepID=A0ACB8TX90_9APHY|nr:hypothetical protein BDY19DRAFT_959691 [Irpex rosettiformis]
MTFPYFVIFMITLHYGLLSVFATPIPLSFKINPQPLTLMGGINNPFSGPEQNLPDWLIERFSPGQVFYISVISELF